MNPNPGAQRQKIDRIAAIERQFSNLPILDGRAEGARSRVQENRGGLDGHAVSCLANFEREIKARHLVDLESDRPLVDLFESGRLGAYSISAWKQSRNEIVAALIGHCGARNTCSNIRGHDFGARNAGPGLVVNGSGELRGLAERAYGEHTKQRQQSNGKCSFHCPPCRSQPCAGRSRPPPLQA